MRVMFFQSYSHGIKGLKIVIYFVIVSLLVNFLLLTYLYKVE